MPSPTATPFESPLGAHPINLSAYGYVGAEDLMIGGFIVGGEGTKRVLISGVGPDLANYGVTTALANPILHLYSGSTQLGINDDWRDGDLDGAIAGSGRAPNHPLEAAILVDLAPGAYTAILAGVEAGSGAGLVQVFDLSGGDDARFENISTRLRVGTGDQLMIAGWILEGAAPRNVIVRGLGPTLATFDPPVADVLADPELVVLAGDTVLARNFEWMDSPDAAEIAARGLAPAHDSEAALMISLPPGSYTGILSGAGGGTGNGLIEVYAVD